MTYLLDTNACIYFLNGTPAPLIERILHCGPRGLAVSSLSVAELHFGAARSARRKANLERVHAFLRELKTEPFTDGCAAEFGRVKAELLKAGTPIPDFDIAIAATALALDYRVVSSDADLRRVRGLDVEDWALAAKR
jgi:tRNA(fMet)-specific endonuclease VapC